MRRWVSWVSEELRRWPLLAAAVPALVLAVAGLLLPVPGWLRWPAVAALAWWLPGALLVAHWRLRDLELPTAGVLALGLGLCWLVAVGLLLHTLPGPLTPGLLAAGYGGGALLLAVALVWHRPLPHRPVGLSTWFWLLALLALAALLRLPGLDYHQLHTDESVVLLRAGRAAEGQANAFANHAKGPGELAVAAVFYAALGTAGEGSARLPFALLGVGSVVAVALLGRRLFTPGAGFWAGVLLAGNGFALALSRIVQYQGAVLLLTALAVLAAWEFARKGEIRWLALAIAFSALGLVMHYEFGLLAPALLVLAWTGWRRAPDRRRTLGAGLLAAAVAGLLLAGAYLPVLLSPGFGETQDYISMRLGGLGSFNLAFFVEMGTFYNSTFYLAGLVLLALAGLVLGWRGATDRHRALRAETALLVLWFAPFFLLYFFVMEFPGTHYYLLMESWSLLAALPLAVLARTSAVRPIVRWAGFGLVVAWLALSAGYLYLMFFRQSPETLAHYEETLPAIYRAPYGEDVPLQPRFGFAVQEGWEVPGLLATWGYLPGPFASNERSRSVAGWYLRALDRERLREAPAVVLVANVVEKANVEYDDAFLEGYRQVGEVRVRGEPRLALWAREPLAAPYLSYDAEDFALFDAVVPALASPPDPPITVREVSLGQGLVLQSAGLERDVLPPGDLLHLLLVWRPELPLSADYKLFVHVVGDDGRPLAQWDGLPCLNTARTSLWPAGQVVRDHVLFRLPGHLARGRYRLLAGLYDPASGERLGGQAVEVGSLRVR